MNNLNLIDYGMQIDKNTDENKLKLYSEKFIEIAKEHKIHVIYGSFFPKPILESKMGQEDDFEEESV